MKVLLHSKRNSQQNGKETYSMVGDIFKSYFWLEANTQTIEGTNSYNSTPKNNLNLKNGQRNWIDTFSKGGKQMANRHMKRYSVSLIIRKMQVKTTMRYHLPSIRMAVIKRIEYNKCCCWCREKETIFCTLGGNAKSTLYSCYGKQHGVSSKVKNRMTIGFCDPSSGYILKKMKSRFWRDICTSIFITTLFTMVKIQMI